MGKRRPPNPFVRWNRLGATTDDLTPVCWLVKGDQVLRVSTRRVDGVFVEVWVQGPDEGNNFTITADTKQLHDKTQLKQHIATIIEAYECAGWHQSDAAPEKAGDGTT